MVQGTINGSKRGKYKERIMAEQLGKKSLTLKSVSLE